jgi:hypothetical protein
MKKRGNFASGFLGVFLLLFFLITVSHDCFCHEELHSVCGPLHSFFQNSAPDWAESISFLPPSLPLLTWNQDHILRPDFIKNIFHPPD